MQEAALGAQGGAGKDSRCVDTQIERGASVSHEGSQKTGRDHSEERIEAKSRKLEVSSSNRGVQRDKGGARSTN